MLLTTRGINDEQPITGTLDFGALVSRHRKYFQTGVTRSAEWRESQLTALRTMMRDHADDFYKSLWSDLHRNHIDADWTDVKYVASRLLRESARGRATPGVDQIR